MLANALVCVAMIALCATTVLSAGTLAAREAMHRLAQNALPGGYQRGLDSLTSVLRTYARSGAFPNPLPAIAPLDPACADASSPCGMFTGVSFALTRTDLGLTQGCDQSSIVCAMNEQSNAYALESRIHVRITVTIRASDGAALASRGYDVAVRALPAPPYIAIAGARDATVDVSSGEPVAGDDGGAPPATSNPCTPPSPGAADDTVIRVAYRDAQSGACSNGSAWHSSSY